MSGFEISAWLGMGVFVITGVSVFTTQWNRVNHNKERTVALEEAVNKTIPKLIGGFKDDIVEKTNNIQNAVSKLEGRLDGIFTWMKKNGRK